MQLGWIDFSKEDRQKALDVINLLSEQGAVDELGIGIIRDAFATISFLEHLPSRPEQSTSLLFHMC